jgi:UDP-glucose 4-epimerase
MTKLLGEQMIRSFGRRGLEFVILRFAATQTAAELLDPNSVSSGPRFYVNAKLRQLRGMPESPNVAKSIAALEAVAAPEEQHYIGCDPSGVAYRMCTCDVRDLSRGIQLALRHPAAPGETFNIGPARSHSFDEMVPYLAGKTGLRVQRVGLFTDSYRYETSIAKAVATLGYAPEFDFFRMVDDAAAHR